MTTDSNYKYIKFSNGQEVIGEISHLDDDILKLKSDAFCIFVAPNTQPNSRPEIGFLPFAPFTADKELVISKSQVLFVANATPELRDHFKRMTNRSNLIVPNSNGLIV